MPLPRQSNDNAAHPVVRHEDCWAKTTESGRPGISVEQHCRTAGVIADLLSTRCPDRIGELLRIRIGVLLAALHDVGKVAPGFQKKCPAWLKRHNLTAARFAGMEEDHAKISQKTLQDVLKQDGLKWWAAIVGAHHGNLKGDWCRELTDGGEAWASERRRLVEKLVSEFGALPDSPPSSHDCGELWSNAGLIAVADWLASDERTFPPSKALEPATIRERAQAQLERLGFRSIACASGKRFAELFSFPPNPVQCAVVNAVRSAGIYIVEGTMGCGKTEAALMAAYNLISTGQATGLYFALPTQVTSNRIHTRVQAFVERAFPGSGTRLTHGNSWLLDVEEAITDSRNGDQPRERTGRDWFASSRRGLLAAFGVGTVDQALLGVVAAKHFFVRQYGLAGKVVVLDEVHSYDLYTGTLLDRLVNRLRELGATVIVLSATLTAARRRELLGNDPCAPLDAYPLISAAADGRISTQSPGSEPAKAVRAAFKDESTLVDSCIARAERGACVLWIRNTVEGAQDTYRRLRNGNREGGPEIGLLHARFPQYRREELENDWLERLGKDQTRRPAGGCVLVATQVAEQSVDIDADLLITDLAPTDMLLQRLGRLWRHSRVRPVGCEAAEAWIANPALSVPSLRAASAAEIKAAFGKSAKVYAPYVLLRTFELWLRRAELALPTDIRRLLEATYAEPEEGEPAAWRELRDELERRKRMLRDAAASEATVWQPALPDEEGVKTRWNSCPTVPVILMAEVIEWDAKTGARLRLWNGDLCTLRSGDYDFTAAKALHRNLARVPRWCIRDCRCALPAWFRDHVAGDAVACQVQDGKLLAWPDRKDTGLTYRDDLGVMVPSRPVVVPTRNRHEEEDDYESYD